MATKLKQVMRVLMVLIRSNRANLRVVFKGGLLMLLSTQTTPAVYTGTGSGIRMKCTLVQEGKHSLFWENDLSTEENIDGEFCTGMMGKVCTPLWGYSGFKQWYVGKHISVGGYTLLLLLVAGAPKCLRKTLRKAEAVDTLSSFVSLCDCPYPEELCKFSDNFGPLRFAHSFQVDQEGQEREIERFLQIFSLVHAQLNDPFNSQLSDLITNEETLEKYLDKVLQYNGEKMRSVLRSLLENTLKEFLKRKKSSETFQSAMSVILSCVNSIVIGSSNAAFRSACLKSMKVLHVTIPLDWACHKGVSKVRKKRKLFLDRIVLRLVKRDCMSPLGHSLEIKQLVVQSRLLASPIRHSGSSVSTPPVLYICLCHASYLHVFLHHIHKPPAWSFSFLVARSPAFSYRYTPSQFRLPNLVPKTSYMHCPSNKLISEHSGTQ
ncbi:hypothetical protein C0J50_22834 [Silurus asotus]|uniref:Uncharacterized protein n=1 Tax=Silurus asotus TaxID=30991 RepID=A0AAD5AJ38_SILAS|nr:hypothetical protein C0J50_22834 [Silurus asotus]